jgi:hypothetical protein
VTSPRAPLPPQSLPERPARYRRGASTPHPIRFNDALWADFCAHVRAQGHEPSEALRALVEALLVAANAVGCALPQPPPGTVELASRATSALQSNPAKSRTDGLIVDDRMEELLSERRRKNKPIR